MPRVHDGRVYKRCALRQNDHQTRVNNFTRPRNKQHTGTSITKMATTNLDLRLRRLPAFRKRPWKRWQWQWQHLRTKSQKTKRFTILDLPLDILYMITDFTPKSSTLCFALSSKRLLHSLASLKSLRVFKRFRLLQCVPNAFQPREDSSRREQRQFLRLLSRDTAPAWVYCTDCVELHPAREFAAIQRDGSDVYGRCLMGVSYVLWIYAGLSVLVVFVSRDPSAS
jgi:hypothetical protein